MEAVTDYSERIGTDMVTIEIKDNLLCLHNDRISYVMAVLDGGTLMHMHFGARVRTMHMQSALRRAVLPDDGFFTTQMCALDRTPQEYPSFGFSDMREGAFTVRQADGTRSADLHVVSATAEDGKPSLAGLPASFGGECKTLRVVLRDELLKMDVTLLYTIFDDCDVIARSVHVKNNSDKPLNVERVMSAFLDLPDNRWEMITLSGGWARERDFVRRPVAPGLQGVSTQIGASSHRASPFVAVVRPETTDHQGEAIGMALVYSGNFFAGCDVDYWRRTRAMIGLNSSDFSWLLEPGESFQAPEAVLAWSGEGLNGMSHQFHRLCQNHIVRGKHAHEPRPILLNNWEATYFDFDEDKLLKIAQTAADTGVELFVLDDGWFGKRNADNCSLGDWKVNFEKLPGGLNSLADKIHAMGLKFGLWFEPEAISPDSDLYRAHPDWCIHIEGRDRIEWRNQLILDLSREDVCEHVYHCIADVLAVTDIDYVKWDMNRNMTCIGSAKLPPERQSEMQHRYMLGLYGVLERVVTEFPNVLFESCAGGGGRFDLGMMHYMPQAWCSDNSDAVARCGIQYSTSLVFPPCTMGAHVSAVPNHQTGRVTPISTRANVAMFGAFGYELDLNKLPAEELDEVREQIKRVKALRKTLLYGTFYRLQSPWTCNEPAWMSVSEDKSEAVVMMMRVQSIANEAAPIVRLAGLDANADYRIEELGEVYGGDELMSFGLSVKLKECDASSVTLTLKKVNE